MYIEPDVKSSYTENNIGKTIYDYVYSKKPNRVLELGALNGYSTVCIGQALRDVGWGTLVSYDLFEDYPYNNSNYKDVLTTIQEYGLSEIIDLKKEDYRWVFLLQTTFANEDEFDIIHLDVSNDGNVIKDISNRFPNSDILFEGGTIERDNVEWMKKYDKKKMYPLKDEIGYEIVDERFPGLSLIRGKK